MTVPKGRKVYALGRVFKAGAELPKSLEKLLEKPVKKVKPIMGKEEA